MKNIGFALGRLAFWLSWPVLWLYLGHGKRTRLLLVCDGEFLALRSWLGSGNWGLPGGGLHKGEDSIAGLLREVKEETGIALTKDIVSFCYSSTLVNSGIKFNYDSYEARLDKKPVIKIQKFEIGDYEWIPLDDSKHQLSIDALQALEHWHNMGKFAKM